MSKTTSFPLAIVIAAGLVCPAAAQEPTADQVKALIEQAMVRLSAQPVPAQGAPSTAQGPTVDMTVEEAVARALENNVTLATQRLTPQTFDFSIAATRAFYRPTVTSTVSNISATQLGRLTTDGGEKTNQDTTIWNAGLTQQVPWQGGSLQVNWANNRLASTQSTAIFNPAYTSQFAATFTQPLLANRKIDNTRTTLLNTEISQDIAQIELQGTAASIVAQVRNAYYELVFAIMNLEAQRTSLELAAKLVEDNRARVEIGTMAPIEVVQAQAEEATRRQAVVNAEAILQNNELGLKRLIVSGTEDPLWASTINAVDRPRPDPEAIDLEGAVRNALSNRTDLQTQRKNVESANVTLSSLTNQKLPTLNLVGTYRLDGRGGLPTSPTLPPSGWWDALGAIGKVDAPTWTVQLNFSYPLGMSAADANRARQEIVIRQNHMQVKAAELQIATEVTAAAIAIRNSLEAIQAATAARELSQKRYEAAQSKLEVGMATNFEVVQAQRDLADATNRELREHLNYRRALVDFQRVQISPR
ncbi:MAG TPA: TolC family protein [Vicinamibacterales bacterium]|nr:TolC family protein [Vicinamibacterales bacterium]